MSLSTFVWLCPCIPFSSITQFPQPCGFPKFFMCGSTLSERRIAELGAIKKNICFFHTAAVPVCPCSVCFFLFLARCPTNSVSSGLGAASRPDSSCTDQMALLPGHSSLFADLDWPNLFVCRPSSSAAWPHLIGLAGGAKVHNGNTQRHFRVVRDACVR